ncbi:MAG TPA: amidase family protein, partial [Prolixibacteraceae bacterium]|nr:amidase family protein [Prolixibacteraceae bacterium]
MNRRHFVSNGFFAGLSLASLPLVSCEPGSRTKQGDKHAAPEFDIVESTIQELQEKVKSGKLSYVALTQFYLKRIKELDKEGPALNSVIELNPDALAIAGQMDQELKEGKWRGPLHGIPVLIKDN